MVDEAKLLVRLKKRQRNSIEQAIELYTPYLSTVLYRTVGNGLPREDVEEIVSDVFVALWKNAEYIDPQKGTVRAYMAATAKNFAYKRLNKKKDTVCLEDIELPDEKNFTEDNASGEVLWNAVMELGEPDNELFVRFYKYNETIREIAKATGLHLSTVKSKLSRGKRKLKKILVNAEESL